MAVDQQLADMAKELEETKAALTAMIAREMHKAIQPLVAGLRPPTFDQLWLTLCPGSEESGVVLISEIAAVVRFMDMIPSGMRGVPEKGVLSNRGVLLTLKSGEAIEAPDAIYSEVKLAMMAAEVTT